MSHEEGAIHQLITGYPLFLDDPWQSFIATMTARRSWSPAVQDKSRADATISHHSLIGRSCWEMASWSADAVHP